MMKRERRHKTKNAPEIKPTELPVDYLRLVSETLTNALDAGLKELKKIHPESVLRSTGQIYGDEVVLAVTLSHGKNVVSATTVYASADYNPNAEKPTLEMVLGACLDAAGSVFDYYLDPKDPAKVAQIADSSLGSLEEAPFEWSAIELNDSKIPVWVKLDKSNPELDTMAEDWLKKHDPDYEKEDTSAEEDFLQERLDAIKAAKSGTGHSGGGSGPITH